MYLLYIKLLWLSVLPLRSLTLQYLFFLQTSKFNTFENGPWQLTKLINNQNANLQHDGSYVSTCTGYYIYYEG
jgi:hypothetical protein